MNTIDIELEDKLIIKVEYYWQPEELAEVGPEALYPGCPASVEDVVIMEIIEGTIDDLVYYVENVDNFNTELLEKVYDAKCEENFDNY